ncbi:MAG TPA: class I adenylate-forming enzyme family protein [Casimicrobiaceae bacterium]|nr:class I adenylate-forming enzyme family protein [Casimicrobiaceae bacterium]
MRAPDQAPALAAALAAPFTAVPDLIARHAEARPEQPALVQGDAVLTFGALNAEADRVAAALQRDGVRPRDVVAISGANSIAYAIVFVGALRAGASVAPIPQSTAPAGLAAMIADSGATHAFVDADVRRALAPHREALRARIVALDGGAEDTSLERWLGTGAARPRPVDVEPDWPFNVIYSSGTTGTPKGIVQPHAMRWTHVQRGSTYGYGPSAVTLISTPLHSNTTLVSFFPALALGGTVILMAKFDAGRYLALAERHRVTHTMLVPVQYQRLLAHPAFDRHDLSSFQAKFCTSAPFTVPLKEEVLRRWPGGLIEFYGMTEGGGTCVLLAHEHRAKLHTVGRPAPGHDIRVIDEAGRELPRGALGEIVGHSPGMMTGYHGRPDATAAAEWFDAQGRRYIRTGDVGRFDDEGFVVLMDRRKDMIISGGFNVYPSDLEAVLREHPGVMEAAVVGVPSLQWGETPVAFVVPAPHAALDAAALRDWANARLGKLQRLADVQTVEALPRSHIGKVLKRELRAAYAARLPSVKR